MRNLKTVLVFTVVWLVVSLGAFAQVPKKETPKKKEPTAFQTRCSVCHSLERVRVEMEKTIKEMHEKAGVPLSDSSLKAIEETFTLKPVEEPHKALFQEKCSHCHSMDRVVKSHQTQDEEQMKKTIERMAEKEKSGISKEETEKIHQSMNLLNEVYEPDVELKKEEKK